MTGTLVVNIRSGDEFDVRIDRRSRWGNPFRIDRDHDRETVVGQFKDWALHSDDARAVWIRAHVHELRGKRLGCWCAPALCHGHVLVAMGATDGLRGWDRQVSA